MLRLRLRLRVSEAEAESTRRRQSGPSFASVERSCSSSNSLTAANRAASSTDHSRRGGAAARAKDAMGGRLKASLFKFDSHVVSFDGLSYAGVLLCVAKPHTPVRRRHAFVRG